MFIFLYSNYFIADKLASISLWYHYISCIYYITNILTQFIINYFEQIKKTYVNNLSILYG